MIAGRGAGGIVRWSIFKGSHFERDVLLMQPHC